MSRESDARDVLVRLTALLEELRGNVGQLNAILVPPEPDPDPTGEKVPQ